MKTYLRTINPAVAVLVFVICIYAAIFDDGVFKPAAMFRGGIPAYFVAKGLFCSSALLLIGKIVGLMTERDDAARGRG